MRYRAMWSAKGEAAVRTVVATARITSGAGTFSIVLGTIDARRRSANLRTPWVISAPGDRQGVCGASPLR